MKSKLNPFIRAFALGLKLLSKVVSFINRRHQALRKRYICVNLLTQQYTDNNRIDQNPAKQLFTVVWQLVLCPRVIDYIKQIWLPYLRIM